jgi:hypothetical protein
MNNHLPPPVREMLALYAEKYAEVRFPGLDLATLKKAAEEVEQATAKVAEAQAAVERLREQAKLLEGELTQKALRALSFLKVYVEGDESEHARFEMLIRTLTARPRGRKPASASAPSPASESGGVPPNGERKRRGRKPKALSMQPANDDAKD